MIRQATIEDAGDIAKLAVKMWASHTLDELKTDFEDVLSNHDSAVFVYCTDGQAVGFAQCGLRSDYVEGTDSSPVGYLEGVFVEDEYRNRGYAKQLVCACEQWAKEKGCLEFASDCELNNTQSLSFHLHTGFQEANRIICFVKKL